MIDIMTKFSQKAYSHPVFAPAFTSRMVLQAEKPLILWGFAPEKHKVSVQINDLVLEALSSENGIWKVIFPPQAIKALPSSVYLAEQDPESLEWKPCAELEDVLFGEVWFCSGQSNMELGVGAEEGGAEELASSSDPLLRFRLVHKCSAPLPLTALQGEWQHCTPEHLGAQGWGGFSAVAYHFGQYLRRSLGVPVGLIQAAYGGSKIHPFIQEDFLEGDASLGQFKEELEAANQEFLQAFEKQKPDSLETALVLHPFHAFDQYDTLKQTTAWNALIHPFLPYTVRGILWYQGESDVGNPLYYNRMKALYKGFMKDFGTVPFYFAQIAPWNYGNDHALLDMWQIQSDFSEKEEIPWVSTVDVGNMEDIHPLRKKPLGERFARLALADCYGKPESVSAHLQGLRKTQEGYELEFDQPLKTKDAAPVKGLRLHSQDRSWLVQGVLKDKSVFVTSSVEEKVDHLSYGWIPDSDGNLITEHGLPAFPFIRSLE